MEKSVKVAVLSTGSKGKYQVLDRKYVEKFNAKNKKTGKQFVISEEKTTEYYNSVAGKVQSKTDKRESKDIEATKKRTEQAVKEKSIKTKKTT